MTEVSIIGAGALGKLYGGLLALSGHTVHFLMRSEYALIQDQGYFDLNFKQKNQSLRVKSPLVYNDFNLLPKADLILVCVKTTENNNLIPIIQRCSKPNTNIVIIQNGIGNEEAFKDGGIKQPLFCGVSSAAVSKADHGAIDIYFQGELRLAPFERHHMALALSIKELLESGAHTNSTSIHDSYKKLRWQKLLWNIPFCALSLIFNKPTNILASDPPYDAIAIGLMKEVQAIAQAEGVELADSLLEKTMEHSKTLTDYYPSMYWDHVNARPIEKHYIFDNAIQIAIKLKCQTPLLTLATQCILPFQLRSATVS